MIEPEDRQHTAKSSEEARPGERTRTEGYSPPEPEPDWGALIHQTAEMGGDIGRLLILELRLALGSVKRMLILSVLAFPIIVLAWVGLSSLPGVLLYEYSGSPALGVAGFFVVQLLALFALRVALRRYRKTLTLPLTRQQVSQFTGSSEGES